MKLFAEQYFKNMAKVLGSISASTKDKNSVPFYEGIELAGKLLSNLKKTGRKIIIIGNGASASIASHISTDIWKNGGIRASAFNDSSLLTCISNDYSYEQVFQKPIEMFADKGDILLAISSSGKSKNILLGVQAAQSKECSIISLSGFESNNPLRFLGNINFYVPSLEYGPVEVAHTAICHGILDAVIHDNKHST